MPATTTSDNTKRLEAKFDAYISNTTFVVSEVENVFSILGSRGGTKGGASTSDPKRAAAAATFAMRALITFAGQVPDTLLPLVSWAFGALPPEHKF